MKILPSDSLKCGRFPIQGNDILAEKLAQTHNKTHCQSVTSFYSECIKYNVREENLA